jgi:hypothetical protein
MEHTVHLGVRAFVEGVNPINLSTTNMTKSQDIPEADPGDWSVDRDDDSPDKVDDLIDFEPGNVLGKLLALINQVCSCVQLDKTDYGHACRSTYHHRQRFTS